MAYPYYTGPQQGQPMPAQAVYGYQQPVPPVPQGQLEQLRAAQAYQTMQQATQAQQAGGGIQWVQGEAGAKAFIVSPGASVLLMDSEGQSFYIKAADGTGMPLPLRIFDYTERHVPQAQAPAQTQEPVKDYVTKEELAVLLQRLEDLERREPKTIMVPQPAQEPEKTEKGGQHNGKRNLPAAQ